MSVQTLFGRYEERVGGLSRRARVLAVAGVVFAASLAPSLVATPAQARELQYDSLAEPSTVTVPSPARLNPTSRGGLRPASAAPVAPSVPATSTAVPTTTSSAPATASAAPSQTAPTAPDAAAAVATSVGLTRTPDISTPDKFIAAVAGPAQESQRETGVPASVTIAQAILESEWGRSDLSKEAQNYFGIKAFDTPGPAGVISMDTWEVFGGKNTTIEDAFKAYNNLNESVIDHGNFLKDNPRYADAFKTSDPKKFAQRIHADGYATDPGYCGKVSSLIDSYNLSRFDLSGGK